MNKDDDWFPMTNFYIGPDSMLFTYLLSLIVKNIYKYQAVKQKEQSNLKRQDYNMK